MTEGVLLPMRFEKRSLVTAVYGSCVSRDVVRTVPDIFELIFYGARSSWISAFSKPSLLPHKPTLLNSSFQNKMLKADFLSLNVKEIMDINRANKLDLLLLDIVDERTGVYQLRTGNFVSLTNELQNSGWAETLSVHHVIRFGTDEHFTLWKNAARKLKNVLVQNGLFDRTFLINASFVAINDDGTKTPLALGRQASEWNNLYARYYDFLSSINFSILNPSADTLYSSASHIWKPAAYHYIDAFYEDVVKKLGEIDNERTGHYYGIRP